MNKFIAILDIGHGNCTVIVDGAVVIIDVGPKSGLLEFLEREGINKIDTVLISHADQDHVAGLIGLLACEKIQIGLVRLNTDSLKASELWKDLLYTLDQEYHKGKVDFDISLTVKHSGQYSLTDTYIEILAPTPYLGGLGPGQVTKEGFHLSSNSISAIVRIIHKDKPVVVLPGDIDNVGLQYLLKSSRESNAPILVFPHHGGNAGTQDLGLFTKALCNVIQPEIVIFSIGRTRFVNPSPIVVEEIKAIVPYVRIVCTQLSKHCSKITPIKETSHLTDKFSFGRDRDHCCAGTILILLTNNNELYPNRTFHQSFIKMFAKDALCMR